LQVTGELIALASLNPVIIGSYLVGLRAFFYMLHTILAVHCPNSPHTIRQLIFVMAAQCSL
jgi:hypothetical protein